MADTLGTFKGKPLPAPVQPQCVCGSCKAELIHEYDQEGGADG